jgi:hypothetical protein
MTLHLGSDFPALVEQTGRFSYNGMRLVQPLGNGKLSHSQHSSIEALGCVPNNNQENIAGPTVRLHNCAVSSATATLSFDGTRPHCSALECSGGLVAGTFALLRLARWRPRRPTPERLAGDRCLCKVLKILMASSSLVRSSINSARRRS